ncbi:MAG: Gfo/Idh/MocA family oxidoreductase [Clostridia bacterium]|nr:Gfo/Idh/MocA family oxidoreductase [Clostridia bacterium]
MTDFGEIKTAIAGLGVIGSVHARILEENGCSPVAVCDLCAEKCEPYSYAEKYTDYARMLDECKPNIVHICTPHYLHADMIIEALNRNINVLCEKPLCISRDEITRILAAEKKSKAILGVCHQNRYNAENRFVKDYIKDKKIVCATANVVWRRDEAYYRSAEWRGRRDTEGGGVLINQALHTLDLMQWFAGFPERVTASVSNLTLPDIIEVEDTAFAVFSGGADFTFFATNGSRADFDVELTLKTSDGCVKVTPGKVLVNNELHAFTRDDRLFGKYCYGTGHDRLIKDFYDCVKKGKPFEINGEEGAKVVRLILAAYSSGGKTVGTL